MRGPWTLRWKLTLWTAGVVGLAVLAFGVGVSVHFFRTGVQDLDDHLEMTARDFFKVLGKAAAPVNWADSDAVQDLFPNVEQLYFIEVEQPQGRPVYRSHNLGGADIAGDGGPGLFHTTDLEGKKVRVGVFHGGGSVLRLAVRMSQVESTSEDLLLAYLVASPLVLLSVGVGGWWVAHTALSPIARIVSTVERITARRLDQRLPALLAQDEIGHLTAVLNKMIDRLEASFQQATRFTADASHELKTPLTIIRGELESALLRGGENTPAQEKLLLNLLEETERLSSITEGLLLLSRADAGKLQLPGVPLNLSALLADLLEDMEILAEAEGLRIEADIAPHLSVVANGQFLRQLLLNLLDNAIKYNHPGGVIFVGLHAENSGGCTVSVANTGPGLPEHQAALVFERFYRGDAARGTRRGGHGLGLSICREIARAHGGEISLNLEREGWTEFRLSLPAAHWLSIDAGLRQTSGDGR